MNPTLHPPSSTHPLIHHPRQIPTRVKLCRLCGRRTEDFPPGTPRHWACRVCRNNYVTFRRFFKREHGRWPTVAEFRAD